MNQKYLNNNKFINKYNLLNGVDSLNLEIIDINEKEKAL